jgi:CDP-diacylglycerol--glycerol-3-phosphate 3-phosphatidyltransferase
MRLFMTTPVNAAGVAVVVAGNVGDYARAMTIHPSFLLLQRCGLLGALALLCAAAPVAALQGMAYAGLWLLQSLALWALCWQQAWQRRALNRPDAQAPLHASLGLANQLSLLRGLLIAATGGLVLQLPDSAALIWAAAACYSVAAILDRVDGFVARRTRHTSLLGAELDTVYDALGLVIAPVLAVLLEKIHASYLLVSAAYYLFVLARARRERLGLPVYPLLPSTLRRTLAGFQMGYVAVVLWPPFQAELTRVAGVAFMLPLLIGFVVDYLVVSGRIDASREAAFEALAAFSARWLQPLLRLLLGLLLLAQSLAAAPAFGLPLQALSALAALLILSGSGARLGALLLLVLWALWPPVPLATPLFLSLLACTVAVLLLGSGRFSLWQGDDHWVRRHDGAA